MRSLLTLAFLVVLATSSFAQSELLSAPVNWKRYKAAGHGVSVMFPKLPLVREVVNTCDDTLSVLYYAYADGAVYELAVSGKLPENRARSQTCLATVKRFGPASVDRRMAKLIGAGRVSEKKLTTIDGRVLVKFNSEKSTHWIISDIDANERWIELAVYHYPDHSINLERFLKSFQFSAGDGTEIANGAEAMIGDPPLAKPPIVPARDMPARFTYAGGPGNDSGAPPTLSPTTPDPNREAARLISKPQARYTDEARDAKEQGKVRLKVTLLENGSVGSVNVITPLKHGLTEQAIAAARQIVFLPKRINGAAVSSVVMIEYEFGLY